MLNFIAAVLAAFAFSSSAHADAFSNEDAACTGICQVHDAGATAKAATSTKPVARDTAAPRAFKRAAHGNHPSNRTS
jgi:hypothetical protein